MPCLTCADMELGRHGENQRNVINAAPSIGTGVPWKERLSLFRLPTGSLEAQGDVHEDPVEDEPSDEDGGIHSHPRMAVGVLGQAQHCLKVCDWLTQRAGLRVGHIHLRLHRPHKTI